MDVSFLLFLYPQSYPHLPFTHTYTHTVKICGVGIVIFLFITPKLLKFIPIRVPEKPFVSDLNEMIASIYGSSFVNLEFRDLRHAHTWP